MDSLTPTLAAAAGGFLPALLWLWFWLREDSAHPEPRKLIALAFLAGMLAVAIVIPIEQWAQSKLANQTFVYIAWSAIEEITKFALAYITVLRMRDNDEPIDPIIYMVVVALGFAAAENTLFLLSPLSGITVTQMIITDDYRFVGATLLHVLASATIGGAMALSFFRPWRIRLQYLIAGVILSIFLHGVFNVLIMNSAPDTLIRTFSFVWAGLIALLAFLEFIKRMPRRR